MEHEEQAEQMERDAERMEHDSERVGDHIDEARTDWEAKEQDQSVPGAQADPDEVDEQAADDEDEPAPDGDEDEQ